MSRFAAPHNGHTLLRPVPILFYALDGGLMAHVTPPERGARVRFPPPLVYLISALAGTLLHYALAPAALPIARTISAVGGVLIIVLGLGIIASARTLHRKTGQNPIPWKPTPELIFDGPYRFTRNPMYIGATVIQVGVGVAFNNAWIALLAIPSLVAVHFIAVRPEEQYLSEKFGERYAAYLGRVRRYL
jgi:protein-S-isoprenylcysteine O-methyltransferase Ste14